MQVECSDCGELVSYEQCEGSQCEECWHDSTFPCCLCHERCASDPHEGLLVVFDGDGLSVIGGELEPGVYKIIGNYFSDGMIEYRMFADGLEKIADLPVEVESEYPCGHVCELCQKQFAESL